MTDIVVPKPFKKAPLDVLPYGFDWVDWLAVDVNGVSDTIVSVVMTGSPDGLTISDPTVDGTFTTATVSGGDDGTSYELQAEITTAGGMIACSQNVLNVKADVR